MRNVLLEAFREQKGASKLARQLIELGPRKEAGPCSSHVLQPLDANCLLTRGMLTVRLALIPSLSDTQEDQLLSRADARRDETRGRRGVS